MDHFEYLYRAKYHFSIVQRMLESYELFPEKRLLVGVINESAKSTANLIRSFVVIEGKSGDFISSFRIFSSKYVSKEILKDLLSILEIERAQKTTPVEFQKDDRMIFLVNGKYKILLISRLKELILSLESAMKVFPKVKF